MSMDRIPLKPKRIQAGPQWATVCEDRSPKFKAHANRGHAKAALADKFPHHAVTLYELRDDEWVPVVDIPSGLCIICGCPGGVHPLNYDAKPRWVSPVACWSCYKIHWGYNATEPLPIPDDYPIEKFIVEEGFKYE